jgi:hypothetical protein
LYERLNAARFSPTASDRAALVAEVKALLPRLGRQRASAAGRWTRVVTLLAALLVARRGAGQAPPAEQLYDAGALEEAAAGFAKRTEAEPAVPAHWYNLGAAQFRSGEDGLAAASWTIAHRLAPRDHAIRRALQLVPAPDAGTDRWLWTAPVTPEELLLLAIAAWLVGWAGLFLRPKPGGRWLVLIVAGPLVAAAAGGLEAWYHRPVALVASDSKLRVSPHGRAPELFAEGKGTAVLIRRDASGWRLVRDAAGREGWLETSAIVSLDGRR